MGIEAGTHLRAYCGAEIAFEHGCPDEPVQQPVCACGAEFLPYRGDLPPVGPAAGAPQQR